MSASVEHGFGRVRPRDSLHRKDTVLILRRVPKNGPAPVSIQTGLIQRLRNRVSNHSEGMKPRRLASETEDCRVPRNTANSSRL